MWRLGKYLSSLTKPELEELKEKWKMLSDEVANQKLVTQKILEKAVNDKIKTMVSDYKYASIILFVLLAVLLWFIISLDFLYKIFLLVLYLLNNMLLYFFEYTFHIQLKNR